MLPLPLPSEVRLTYAVTSPCHWLPLRRARRLHAPLTFVIVSVVTPETLSNCACKSLPAPETRFAAVMPATQSPPDVRSAEWLAPDSARTSRVFQRIGFMGCWEGRRGGGSEPPPPHVFLFG